MWVWRAKRVKEKKTFIQQRHPSRKRKENWKSVEDASRKSVERSDGGARIGMGKNVGANRKKHIYARSISSKSFYDDPVSLHWESRKANKSAGIRISAKRFFHIATITIPLFRRRRKSCTLSAPFPFPQEPFGSCSRTPYSSKLTHSHTHPSLLIDLIPSILNKLVHFDSANNSY